MIGVADIAPLFPAYAGVIPGEIIIENLTLTFPRIRGGDPIWWKVRPFSPFFSPHTRG